MQLLSIFVLSKKQKENKGGKDVEGKIFADMLSGVWNDAGPLEHNAGDTCKVVQCVILRALNVQLRPIAMSAMFQCAIMKRAMVQSMCWGNCWTGKLGPD